MARLTVGTGIGAVLADQLDDRRADDQRQVGRGDGRAVLGAGAVEQSELQVVPLLGLGVDALDARAVGPQPLEQPGAVAERPRQLDLLDRVGADGRVDELAEGLQVDRVGRR